MIRWCLSPLNVISPRPRSCQNVSSTSTFSCQRMPGCRRLYPFVPTRTLEDPLEVRPYGAPVRQSPGATELRRHPLLRSTTPLTSPTGHPVALAGVAPPRAALCGQGQKPRGLRGMGHLWIAPCLATPCSCHSSRPIRRVPCPSRASADRFRSQWEPSVPSLAPRRPGRRSHRHRQRVGASSGTVTSPRPLRSAAGPIVRVGRFGSHRL
jgi:hypothetical protein